MSTHCTHSDWTQNGRFGIHHGYCIYCIMIGVQPVSKCNNATCNARCGARIMEYGIRDAVEGVCFEPQWVTREPADRPSFRTTLSTLYMRGRKIGDTMAGDQMDTEEQDYCAYCNTVCGKQITDYDDTDTVFCSKEHHERFLQNGDCAHDPTLTKEQLDRELAAMQNLDAYEGSYLHKVLMACTQLGEEMLRISRRDIRKRIKETTGRCNKIATRLALAKAFERDFLEKQDDGTIVITDSGRYFLYTN